jgi:hypothetical protein
MSAFSLSPTAFIGVSHRVRTENLAHFPVQKSGAQIRIFAL